MQFRTTRIVKFVNVRKERNEPIKKIFKYNYLRNCNLIFVSNLTNDGASVGFPTGSFDIIQPLFSTNVVVRKLKKMNLGSIAPKIAIFIITSEYATNFSCPLADSFIVESFIPSSFSLFLPFLRPMIILIIITLFSD